MDSGQWAQRLWHGGFGFPLPSDHFRRGSPATLSPIAGPLSGAAYPEARDMDVEISKSVLTDITATTLEGIEGIAVSRFTSADVVRHPIVGRIVDAYEGPPAE